jgi:YidC/Oxa1 family membrane protein insertase
MRSWVTALLVLLLASTVHAQAIRLDGEQQTLLINPVGGLPGRWLSCTERCTGSVDAGGGQTALLRVGDGGSRFAWRIPGDAEASRQLEELVYVADYRRSAAGMTVILSAQEAFRGMRLIHRYTLARDGRTLSVSLQMPPGAVLELSGGDDLVGPRLPGFGSFYSYARAVRVAAAGQQNLTGDEEASGAERLSEPGEWVGLRGRFWTLLLQSREAVQVSAAEPAPDQPTLSLRRAGPGGGSLDLQIYAGPVLAAELVQVAPELRGMLYASLWDWLRALAFGMHWLLGQLQQLVGNWGLAIMLLSLSVKLLMWPLTFVAERWQAEVNRTQSLLQPQLAAIKREFKGEEAHRRTLEVYARNGVSQFYTLKSLAGFLIQIPVFIAAFDMLGENFGLGGAGFLWVQDLSLPDRALALPGALPFFGAHLNLLPVLMTVFTIAAARLQEEQSLSPELLAGQRLRLYAMGALFFVLLYTFPAGMVLYWTTNNLLHLCKILLARLLPAAR